MSKDYVVKDIGQADFGRKEIAIAETEMPGLMAAPNERCRGLSIAPAARLRPACNSKAFGTQSRYKHFFMPILRKS